MAVKLLIAINVVTFLVYLKDKISAMNGGSRVTEKTLLLLSLIGGSAGALCAMYLCRHKIRHMKFVLSVPFMLAIQVFILYRVNIIIT